MVLTRERRSNAGNRMAKLMAMEEPEGQDEESKQYYGQDEWNDAPDDEEFEDLEQQEDIALESSSDPDEDEDEGEDEDAGEQVLRKEERAEKRSKKRKLQNPIFKQPAILKKRKTEPVDPSTPSSQPDSTASAQRPRKKSERVSWLPEPEAGPVRSSKRAQTVQNKEQMHSRLKEKEANRLQLVASMKAAEDRKKNQPRPMTQEERLAMAEQVERENIKTLNKWEDAEKLRQEEQRARIEALKNKQLEGLVISYWSGQAIWADQKLKSVGGRKKVEDVEQETPDEPTEAAETPLEEQQHPDRPEAEKQKQDEDHGRTDPQQQAEQPRPSTPTLPSQDQAESTADSVTQDKPPVSSDEKVESTSDQPTATPLEPTGGKTSETGAETAIPEPKVEAESTTPKAALPAAEPESAALPADPPASNDLSNTTEPEKAETPAQKTEVSAPQSQQKPSTITKSEEDLPVSSEPIASPAPSPAPTHEPEIEVALRNLVTLRGFGLPRAPTKAKDRDRDKEILTKHLLQWPTARLQKPSITTCPITGHSARYRDPASGLPYHDTRAYNCIQRLSTGGGYQWSNLIGAYVGFAHGASPLARPAAGVPERFANPSAAAKPAKAPTDPAKPLEAST
jgi:vacuolar protein sorting-associated protein 72